MRQCQTDIRLIKICLLLEDGETMTAQFKGRTTPKDSSRYAFNNSWIYGDIIYSGGKVYIHPTCNRVNVSGELGRLIIMHEVKPDTVCRVVDFPTPEPFWENDIITEGKAIGLIRYGMFNSKHLGFYIEWQGKYHDMRNDVAYWLPVVERIGNVIDDPELLRGGET